MRQNINQMLDPQKTPTGVLWGVFLQIFVRKFTTLYVSLNGEFWRFSCEYFGINLLSKLDCSSLQKQPLPLSVDNSYIWKHFLESDIYCWHLTPLLSVSITADSRRKVFANYLAEPYHQPAAGKWQGMVINWYIVYSPQNIGWCLDRNISESLALCGGNPPDTVGFPSQMTRNKELFGKW